MNVSAKFVINIYCRIWLNYEVFEEFKQATELYEVVKNAVALIDYFYEL